MQAPSKKGGQVWPEKCKFPESVQPFLDLYAEMKIVTPALLHALNQELPEKYRVAENAVRFGKDDITKALTEFGNNTCALKQTMVNLHCFTFLQYPVKFHCDVPRDVSERNGDYSFLEYKFVFEDPEESDRWRNNPVKIARLRGGDGANRAIVAVATHDVKKKK